MPKFKITSDETGKQCAAVFESDTADKASGESRGRLYFQPKYVEDLQWVEKSTEFVKWADGIIAKFRRKLKKSTYF